MIRFLRQWKNLPLFQHGFGSHGWRLFWHLLPSKSGEHEQKYTVSMVLLSVQLPLFLQGFCSLHGDFRSPQLIPVDVRPLQVGTKTSVSGVLPEKLQKRNRI